MLQDDGILYMGTRPAQRAASNHPFPMARRQLTGIALVIEKPGGEGGYGNGMIFRRAITSVVHIGRRPSSEAERRHRDSDTDKAMFRCAVVSRQHAQITFTDSGNVVLVDLNSHHGTHVRKPDETVSRMLTPQTPTILADGDVITFGKSVGKNESLVRPVVARVDFLHGGQPPLKPLVVPNYHSIGEGSKCLSRANSGRYGVYVPSPSSVSSSDDVSSHDSDIEEISAPCGNIQLLPSIAVDGSLGQAMKALRHIIPSVHSERELSSPSLPSYSPEYQPYSPTSPPEIELQDEFFNVGSDAYDSDISEDSTSDDGHKSRSNSPMDLSSPSSEPFIPSTPLSKAKSVPVEPVVIGAWPTSHSSSPVVTKSPSPPAEVHASIPECDTSQPGEISTPEAEAVVDVAEVGDSEAPEIVVLGKEIVPASEAMQLAAAAEEFNGLKSVVNAIKSEVAKLQAHRRKYKSRFNGNVHIITGKLTELDERIVEVSELYQVLSERVDEGETDIQAEVEALQHQVDALGTPKPELALPPLIERDEVKASTQALELLVTEMTLLRDNTKKMAEELKEVQEAALKSMAEVQVQTTSLKRKRSDDEGYEDVTGNVVMQDTASPAVGDTKAILTDGPSPPKRARRVVSAVVQTATAITLGAVVTWSALAFS